MLFKQDDNSTLYNMHILYEVIFVNKKETIYETQISVGNATRKLAGGKAPASKEVQDKAPKEGWQHHQQYVGKFL